MRRDLDQTKPAHAGERVWVIKAIFRCTELKLRIWAKDRDQAVQRARQDPVGEALHYEYISDRAEL